MKNLKHAVQFILLMPFFSIFFPKIAAQTIVSGGIFTNTVWTKVNSPYIVTSNVVIFDGVTLTIEPGVVVKVNDSVFIEIRNGKLLAIGNQQDSITFTANNLNPDIGQWKGIIVSASSLDTVQNQISMNYCKGLYAKRFLDFENGYSPPYTFKNCLFANNNVVFFRGVPYNGLNYVIENSQFINNDIGIEGASGYIVRRCLFKNNRIGAKATRLVEDCTFEGNTEFALEPYGTTINSLFKDNKIGIHAATFNSENKVFTGNIVKNNAVGVEIYTFFDGNTVFKNNTICNNTLYNIRRFANNNSNSNFADLSQNCWCTTDSLEIEKKILDAKDDVTLGLIRISTNYNCETLLSIDKNFLEKTLKIYPNPTTDIINVESNDTDIFDIKVFNALGQLVQQLTPHQKIVLLDLRNQQTGIYHILINHLISKKVVKE